MGTMVSPIIRIKITPIIRLQEEDIRSWQINDAKLYGSSFLPIIYRTHCHLSFVSESWPLQVPVHRYSMCFWSWEEKRSLLKTTNQSSDRFFTNGISSINEMFLCFFFCLHHKILQNACSLSRDPSTLPLLEFNFKNSGLVLCTHSWSVHLFGHTGFWMITPGEYSGRRQAGITEQNVIQLVLEKVSCFNTGDWELTCKGLNSPT